MLYGAMAQGLRRWIPNPGVPSTKPMSGSMVDSAFHPSKEGLTPLETRPAFSN